MADRILATKAQFARLMGVAPPGVSFWIGKGLPVRDDGLIDAEAGALWVYANVDPKKRLTAATRTARQRIGLEAERPADWRSLVPGTAHLTNPVEAAVVTTMLAAVYHLAALAPIFAIEAGATCAQAWRLHAYMRLAMVTDAGEMLDEAGIDPPPGAPSWGEADIWQPAQFRVPNWPHLAAQAGEPHDEAAWAAAHAEVEARRTAEAA